jgi:acyl-CoA synthetase (AMP-forming)/AMP-acid ligase II
MANIAEQLHNAAKRGGWLDRPAFLDGAASWSHRDIGPSHDAAGSRTDGSARTTSPYRRPGGRHVYVGRSDDMEIAGGINVSPPEVEAVLREHPGVREVAVIPDERGIPSCGHSSSPWAMLTRTHSPRN